MPKYLPQTLEGPLSQFDTIIDQQAAALASSQDAKVSVADICRLVQLRLDLEDRFAATKPQPGFAGWVDPAWMIEASEVPDAVAHLDRLRAEYLALAEAPPHRLS
jgi:hypothetical protein